MAEEEGPQCPAPSLWIGGEPGPSRWQGKELTVDRHGQEWSFRKGSVHLSRVIGHWGPLNGVDRPSVYFEHPLAVVHMEKALKKSSESGRPGRGWCRKEGEKWGASDPGQRKGWLWGVCKAVGWSGEGVWGRMAKTENGLKSPSSQYSHQSNCCKNMPWCFYPLYYWLKLGYFLIFGYLTSVLKTCACLFLDICMCLEACGTIVRNGIAG